MNARTSSDRFEQTLSQRGVAPPVRTATQTVQVNVGKLCNQACHHCHVEAGPKRTEVMSAETAARLLQLLERSNGVATVDLTGGAPELNPNFRSIVAGARALGMHVIDRCNLTVLFEPGMDWIPGFLADNRVGVVCSLPCYTAENVDKQRGKGVFDKSIEGLRLLARHGYGRSDALPLDLVFNPVADTLPPEQASLEAKYREELRALFGIEFRQLLTITNMPIKRFEEQLVRWGRLDAYLDLLAENFNPHTVDDLMCRNTVSVGWDGSLYDCDFNQMLELPAGDRCTAPTLFDIDSFDAFDGAAIRTGSHCLGCTAGSGSSCGGALA